MNIILKIFLISFILIVINYPVFADGKTKIEVNVYMQLQPIERNLNTKEIKMIHLESVGIRLIFTSNLHFNL